MTVMSKKQIRRKFENQFGQKSMCRIGLRKLWLLQRSVPLRRNPRLCRGQGKDDLRASQDQQVSTHRRLEGVKEKTHLKDCVQETALGQPGPTGSPGQLFAMLGHPGTRMPKWAWLPPWWPETGASFISTGSAGKKKATVVGSHRPPPRRHRKTQEARKYVSG